MNYRTLYRVFLFGGLFLLLILALVFFFAVFTPAVKNIAKMEKEAADLQLKIERYRQHSRQFVNLDQKEQKLIAQINQLYVQAFPEEGSMESLTDYFASLLDEIRKLSSTLDLMDLTIKSKNQFIQIELGQVKKKKQRAQESFSPLPKVFIRKKKEERQPSLEVSFKAPVENGVRFVQLLLHNYPSLQLQDMSIKRERGLASFSLKLKIKTRRGTA